LGDPNNQIFGYSVIQVTRISKFGYLGRLKKTEETEFGDKSGSQIEWGIMSPVVPAHNDLIMVLAMAPSGLCPSNSAHGEVCGTTNFWVS
jgi:hypothetical protein